MPFLLFDSTKHTTVYTSCVNSDYWLILEKHLSTCCCLLWSLASCETLTGQPCWSSYEEWSKYVLYGALLH